MLISAGSDISAVSNDGKSLLKINILRGHTDIAEALISAAVALMSSLVTMRVTVERPCI
jgi:hypothetical protein